MENSSRDFLSKNGKSGINITAPNGTIITHLGISYSGNVPKESNFNFKITFFDESFINNIKLNKRGVLDLQNVAIKAIQLNGEILEPNKLNIEYETKAIN